MTTEIFFLLLTALLGASLWIPYIVGTSMSEVETTDFTRPMDPSAHPPWVHRAFRAHLNLLEQMLPFAVIVLIAHVTGVSTALTTFAAGAFFVIRVTHAVGMITGFAGFPLRPIIFSAGWICILVIAVEIFRLA